MATERNYFGRSQDEWIDQVESEARRDAVALAVIVQQGKEGFHLQGEALTEFVRQVIEHLIAKGAQVVVGSKKPGIDWELAVEFDGSPADIASQVLARWKQSGTDQAYFAWFSYNAGR